MEDFKTAKDRMSGMRHRDKMSDVKKVAMKRAIDKRKGDETPQGEMDHYFHKFVKKEKSRIKRGM